MIHRVELTMRSANSSSGRSFDGNVLEPGQRDFAGNIDGLQMTASSGMNSHRDLNRIDETRGITTVEAGGLLVNERNIGRETPTHHRIDILTKLIQCGPARRLEKFYSFLNFWKTRLKQPGKCAKTTIRVSYTCLFLWNKSKYVLRILIAALTPYIYSIRRTCI